MATHSSILVWRIPWTEEPGELQSMGLQKVRQDRATFTFTFSQGHSAGRLVSLQGPYDIKGWHGSFQDLAHLKKLHPTLNGISLHQFNLRRIPLAKSPSSSNLYPASGCTAGRQFSCQGFWNFQARNPVVSWPTTSILPTKDVVFHFEESKGLALMLICYLLSHFSRVRLCVTP